MRLPSASAPFSRKATGLPQEGSVFGGPKTGSFARRHDTASIESSSESRLLPACTLLAFCRQECNSKPVLFSFFPMRMNKRSVLKNPGGAAPNIPDWPLLRPEASISGHPVLKRIEKAITEFLNDALLLASP
jgi:hypothetical protein